MKKRIAALLLALTMILSLCAVSALADEQKEDRQADTSAEAAEPVSPAGPDGDTEAEYVPDALGQVSFANLERRMRENNLNLLALEENVAAIECIDYDKMYDELRQKINETASQQMGALEGAAYEPMAGQLTMMSLQQQYDAYRNAFEDIKDGKLQKDNAGVVRQLRNAEDQVIMRGESLYIALAALEQQETALQRQLAALNRTVEELELRYQMGQVSALQMEQAKAGRSSLVSGMETLQMNIRNYKTQLEVLLGAELTGSIALGAVPEVTAAQLDAVDPETDLKTAKEKSYELYSAKKTLEDAREDYSDATHGITNTSASYQMQSAAHTWKAAQHTYNAAIQNYEVKFHTLVAQVKDCRQILESAKVALACEKDSCAAAELKYEQGTISKNALLDARDKRKETEEKVSSAAYDLFTAYNNYRWAVERGILN